MIAIRGVVPDSFTGCGFEVDSDFIYKDAISFVTYQYMIITVVADSYKYLSSLYPLLTHCASRSVPRRCAQYAKITTKFRQAQLFHDFRRQFQL